jgi:hypothetical protein
LFVALTIVGALAACLTEKKVAPAIQAADTAVRVVSDSASGPARSPPQNPLQIPAQSPGQIAGDSALGLRLVDATETEEYYAYKVEVTLAGSVDTIPGVLTFDLPVATSDGVVHGPVYTMDGDYAGIYSYNPRTRTVSTIPLPRDAAGWASEVKLSPDASHIAYIAGDSTGWQGIVRSWPAAAVVLTTMKAPQAPSDHSYNQVWWVNLDSVEFSWHTDLGRETKPTDPRFPFIAIYASLPAKRFTIDTLQTQPNFRTASKQ